MNSRREQVDLTVPLVRVLLVDDFEPFRSYVASLITKSDHFKIVGEAADGLEGIRKAAELKPDLVVLDVGLPKLNGIEVARRIVSTSPDSKVVVLTGNESLESGARSVGRGCEGIRY